MTKRKKIFLGLLSVIPLVLTLALVILSFISFTYMSPHMSRFPGNEPAIDTTLAITELIPLGLMAIISLILISLIVLTFVIISIKDRSSSENEKLIWTLIILFFSILALPLYWYFKIHLNTEFGFEPEVTDRTN